MLLNVRRERESRTCDLDVNEICKGVLNTIICFGQIMYILFVSDDS